jgi:O-antigen ligase
VTDAATGVAVASVALAAIFFSFFRDSSRCMAVLAAVMATPLFLKLSGSGIELGDAIVASGTGQTFPISLPAVALMCGLVVLKGLKEGVEVAASPLSVPVALLVFWNVLAFLTGLLMDSRLENGLFLVQTLAPMFAFFVPLFLLRRAVDAVRVLTACVVVIGTWVAALLAFTVATSGGVWAMIIGGLSQYLFIFPIYMLHDYVPLVVTVGYGLGLSMALRPSLTRARPLFVAYTLGMLAFLLLAHSKGALLTALFVTVVFGILHRRRLSTSLTGVIVALAFVAVVTTVLFGPETPTVASVRSLEAAGAADESLVVRLFSLTLALETIATNPIAGTMYVASLEDDAFVERRIPNPHNQYLAYAVRGGLVALLLFVVILVLWQRRMFALARRGATAATRSAAGGLAVTFLGVSLISNMFQDNFVQPYSACLLWFLLGVGEVLYLADRRASAAPADGAHLPAVAQTAEAG